MGIRDGRMVGWASAATGGMVSRAASTTISLKGDAPISDRPPSGARALTATRAWRSHSRPDAERRRLRACPPRAFSPWATLLLADLTL